MGLGKKGTHITLTLINVMWVPLDICKKARITVNDCKNRQLMNKAKELRGGTMKTGPDEIFTLDELAAYLKVGKRTLYRLAAQEEIPAFKVGGTWRFRRSDIDRWIEDRSPTEARKGGDARR